MIASFLITLREVIEASLIVATILGILTKYRHTNGIRTVWYAVLAASISCLVLVFGGSFVGFELQQLYKGPTEKLIEGILMVTTAVTITWAVFVLHRMFARYKTHLLVKIRDITRLHDTRGLFWLTFTAVAREGIEIVLFLTTVYLSQSPGSVLAGFGIGTLAGLAISFAFFAATIRMSVFVAFRFTSAFLILFAAGLFARGIHELTEFGVFPVMHELTLPFVPSSTSVAGSITASVFGLTRTMNVLQLALYTYYILVMGWYVYVAKSPRIKKEPSRG